MHAPLRPPVVAAFVVAYALLTYVGRLTVVEGLTVSLIFPAAGVAALWILAESPRHQWRVLAPLVLLHAAMVWLTGGSPLLTLFGSLSIGVQTWVLGLLVRRWCPTILGAGGTASLRSPMVLLVGTAAVAVACLLGAAVGTTGVWVSTGDVDVWTTVAWFARHVAGIVAVGGVGHLAWEWHTQRIPPRTHGGSRRELVLLWVVSVGATTGLFLQPLPLEFLVVALSVWAAARFRTFPAAVLCLVMGSIGLLLTLEGLSAFARMTDPLAGALVCQVFVVTVLMTGLAVGALGDRIDDLYADATRAQQYAAEQAELLVEMTESMGEGLIVLDEAGRVDRSNGASRRLAHRVCLGADDDEALARLVRLVLHPEARHTGRSRGELGVGDVVIPLESSEEIVLAVTRTSLTPERGDGPSRVLLVLREVTDHRSGLRPMASFASTAAHDLRGPLTAIRSWLSIAVEDLEPGSEAVVPLQRAERAADQMGDLIGDLLTHALAESGELAVEDVPLSGPDGVLAQAVHLLGPDDVLDVPDDLPVVRADPVAVRQLVNNLVGNAVKYARPGHPARVQVRAQRKGSRVVVEVEDDGVGVEDEERSLIFQRFHRSGAVRAHFRGTGMGLSICQTVVQRHGGTIECLAVPPGTGSVFRFDLPAAD
ncbi:hypothetical protein GCM10023339_16350 [Alloalcanivorax gelatiniphagus]